LGTLLSEKILKKDFHTPFYLQKVHIEMSQMFFAIALLFILPHMGSAVDYFKPGNNV